ncbi:MAG: hypothetical protein LBK18_04600 [Prevotellaceae bacterium]|jgi:hypothetical protein|nr:hypothetical protein [Prevotellaceae bacterium]
MKQLRKYTVPLLLLFFICLPTSACKEEEETFTTFPAPVWDVNQAEYAVNMTAVVQLPSNLIQYALEEDQLAAFAGEKCVGKGELISNGLYFVTIHGATDQEPQIRFQYYSARNKYLYASGELFAFEADKVFGVIDEPEILPFTVTK